jgi:hypothetical protein
MVRIRCPMSILYKRFFSDLVPHHVSGLRLFTIMILCLICSACGGGGGGGFGPTRPVIPDGTAPNTAQNDAIADATADDVLTLPDTRQQRQIPDNAPQLFKHDIAAVSDLVRIAEAIKNTPTKDIPSLIDQTSYGFDDPFLKANEKDIAFQNLSMGMMALGKNTDFMVKNPMKNPTHYEHDIIMRAKKLDQNFVMNVNRLLDYTPKNIQTNPTIKNQAHPSQTLTEKTQIQPGTYVQDFRNALDHFHNHKDFIETATALQHAMESGDMAKAHDHIKALDHLSKTQDYDQFQNDMQQMIKHSYWAWARDKDKILRFGQVTTPISNDFLLDAGFTQQDLDRAQLFVSNKVILEAMQQEFIKTQKKTTGKTTEKNQSGDTKDDDHVITFLPKDLHIDDLQDKQNVDMPPHMLLTRAQGVALWVLHKNGLEISEESFQFALQSFPDAPLVEQAVMAHSIDTTLSLMGLGFAKDASKKASAANKKP